MDEADILGDKIAIVKEGRLRAYGRAKYLKKKFGLGYLLRFSMTEHSSVNTSTYYRSGRCIQDRLSGLMYL
jgi:ATP-binding cassette subfamily A (ABC1) protein 3